MSESAERASRGPCEGRGTWGILGVLHGVFAFLQLGDVELGLGAIQPFEPHLFLVDRGDDGTEEGGRSGGK